MALICKLSRYDYSAFEYGRSVTFKLYDEAEGAFNASTYTSVEMKFLDDKFSQILNDITCSWTTQASGIGTFAFTSTDRPTVKGYHHVIIAVSKSGEYTESWPVRVIVGEGVDA